MNEFFAHPIWQVIGVVLSLLALMATFIVYFKQRRRKVLAYFIETRVPLVSVSEKASGDIEIFYQGKKVKDVYLYQIRVFNAGNKEITIPSKEEAEKNLETPLSFTFGENATVRSAGVTQSDPEDLGADVEYEGSQVTLKPLRLKRKETLTLRVVASQADEQVKRQGRIADTSIVQAKNPPEMYSKEDYKVYGQVLGSVAVLIVIGFVLIAIGLQPLGWISIIVGGVLAVASIVILLQISWKVLFIS